MQHLAFDSKPCLKSGLPSPAGVEMAVAAALTGAAAWIAIEGFQLHTAEVYIEEHLISRCRGAQHSRVRHIVRMPPCS